MVEHCCGFYISALKEEGGKKMKRTLAEANKKRRLNEGNGTTKISTKMKTGAHGQKTGRV